MMSGLPQRRLGVFDLHECELNRGNLTGPRRTGAARARTYVHVPSRPRPPRTIDRPAGELANMINTSWNRISMWPWLSRSVVDRCSVTSHSEVIAVQHDMMDSSARASRRTQVRMLEFNNNIGKGRRSNNCIYNICSTVTLASSKVTSIILG